MNWLKMLLLSAVVLTVSVTTAVAKSPKKKDQQPDVTPLAEISPKLQGEWVVVAHSYNKGVTVDLDEPPYTLAYVSNNTAVLGNGKVISVQKVVRTKGVDGEPIDAILFKNGVLWGVSAGKHQDDKAPMWMVQVYQRQDDDEIVETTRVVIRILKNKDKYNLP